MATAKQGAAEYLSAVLDESKHIEARIDPIASVKQTHLRVRNCWNNKSESIKEYWSSLDREARSKFIKTIQPFTPVSVQEPYYEEADGSKVDVPGTVLIHELTLESLSEAENLYYLFDHYTEFEDVSVYGYDAVLNVREISKRVDHSFIEEAPEKEERRIYNMHEGLDFGKCFIVNKMNETEVTQYVAEGIMVDEQEFQIVWFRLTSIFSMLDSFVDEYTASVQGCNVCGALTRSDNQPLLQCSRCMFAYYCSPECQKSDWKAHKKQCKEIARQREQNICIPSQTE